MQNNKALTPIWQPSQSALSSSNIKKFMDAVNQKYGTKHETYDDLYDWSIESYEDFWGFWWEYGKFIHSSPPTKTVEEHASIADLPKWFPGVKMNFAENLLRFKDDLPAIIATGEGVNEATVESYAQVEHAAQQWAYALQQAGIECGDRVAGYLPNCPTAIHAMLGTATLGGVWCSASPDFGPSGVLERLGQVEPKVLIAVDAVRYNGKVHDNLSKVREVVEGLPSLQLVVLLPFVHEEVDCSSVPKSVSVDSFLPETYEPVPYRQLPFHAPLFIMFSSGTTGKPKCIVHGVGGTLIQIAKEHQLHCDIGRKDVFLYYTTTGWMMWQWLVTGLYSGCCLVLYDGSPMLPHAATLWDVVDKYGVTVLGTGAKYLAVLEAKAVVPIKTHSLTSLRLILSTGSPLTEQAYAYVYSSIKASVLLGSISGGTDIISCFVGCCPISPLYSGAIQKRMLGMSVEMWDSEGRPVEDAPGELVCTRPFPSMPVAFWGRMGREKYLNAYFARFPGVWYHGDYCVLCSRTGGVLMLGRSDGVLNPNGVRFGSAEIYKIVEGHPEIEDSVCVGQRNKSVGEERVVLFLKMLRPCPASLFPAVVARLKSNIRSQLSARHVPAVILPVEDIPYTVSGKKVEVAVRKSIHGVAVDNTSSLADPSVLRHYRDIKELQDWLSV